MQYRECTLLGFSQVLMSPEVCPVIEGNLFLFKARVKAGQARMTQATCQLYSKGTRKAVSLHDKAPVNFCLLEHSALQIVLSVEFLSSFYFLQIMALLPKESSKCQNELVPMENSTSDK